MGQYPFIPYKALGLDLGASLVTRLPINVWSKIEKTLRLKSKE